MDFRIKIKGTTPLIMHSGDGLNPRHPLAIEKAEITRKRGGNRTEADDARLATIECYQGFWLDESGKPTIPAPAFRAAIETAARKYKQGPQVREGLVVLETAFHYDEDRYGKDIEELTEKTAFTVGVVVQRSRTLRTRPRFEPPWGATALIDADEELIDRDQLTRWLTVAGKRIGIGDWRPEKSGVHGRFDVLEVTAVEPDY